MICEDTLTKVWTEFNRRLGHLGTIVIAGGAVRDTLLNRDPKDYDVFILDPVVPIEDWDTDILVGMSLGSLDRPDDPKWSAGISDDFIGSYVWQGHIVQVMWSKFTTMADLLNSFDWNISQFGFDGKNITNGMIETDIYPGAELILKTVRWPLSTMKRGVGFAKRFHMRLRGPDLLRLTDAIMATQTEIDYDEITVFPEGYA